MIAQLFTVFLGISRLADVLVLPPDRHQSAPPDMSIRLIEHQCGTVEVCTHRSDSDEPRVFVLRFTGGDAPGAAIVTAQRWRGRAAEVWVANYPGYGGSSGPRSLAMITSSALVTYDELRRAARDRPIVIEGFSLGTVPALAVAARRNDVGGVILQNGPPIKQLAIGHFGWWNLCVLATLVALEVPDDLDSIANARRCTAPAIFLIADQDRTVPPRFQRMISDAYAGRSTRVIIQRGADHVVALSESEERELQSAMSSIVPPPATRSTSR
jgi:pimeloyl-ACP methyl ester carboxylesterase